MEFYLACIASTTSGSTNPRRLIRERLESHPRSNHRQGLGTQPYSNQWQDSGSNLTVNTFYSFTNTSDILNVIPSLIKSPTIGYFLWRGHCSRVGIKDPISSTNYLSKHTEEVIFYLVLTGEGCLGPDILLETPQQAESIKNMIRAM